MESHKFISYLNYSVPPSLNKVYYYYYDDDDDDDHDDDDDYYYHHYYFYHISKPFLVI